MPYKQTEVPAELLLKHNGVSIFHTYKHDDIENVRRTYWYVTDAFDGESDSFDVRELPACAERSWDDRMETIRAIIIEAIDDGIITSEGMKEVTR